MTQQAGDDRLAAMKLFPLPGPARRALWRVIVIAGVLGVGALLVVGRDASPSTPRDDPSPPRPAAAASPISSVRPALSVGGALPPARRVPGPGEVDVCGGDPVSADALADLGSQRQVATRAQVDGLIDAMRFHPDPTVRAAGLLLGDSAAGLDYYVAVDVGVPGCADATCATHLTVQARQRRLHLARQRLAALVELALDSRDLSTYALAAQWCASAGQEVDACRQVSLAEWARRDPDNMAPWLRLAQQADARKDAEARDEALFRAVAAGRQDHHHQAVVGAALAALPDGTDAMVQQHLLALALDVRNAKLLPVFNAMAACEPARLGDANRWQRCDGLADALTRRGASMLELRMGLRIGRAVGWSADRVAALAQEAEALGEAHVRVLGTQPGLSCPEAQVFRQFVAETGEHGELATTRVMLARSGKTPEALATARRERMAAWQAAASAAEAAASTASQGGR